LCAGEQIMAREHGRDGLRLDGGGGFVALLAHGLQDGRSQLEFFKLHGSMCARPGRWVPVRRDSLDLLSRQLQTGGVYGEKFALR
jgi:hypothetical protein